MKTSASPAGVGPTRPGVSINKRECRSSVEQRLDHPSGRKPGKAHVDPHREQPSTYCKREHEQSPSTSPPFSLRAP